MYSDIKKRCIVRRLVKQASASRLVKLARAAAALQNLRMMEKDADRPLREPGVGKNVSHNVMKRLIDEREYSPDQFEQNGKYMRYKGGRGAQLPAKAASTGTALALRNVANVPAKVPGTDMVLHNGGSVPATYAGNGGQTALTQSGGPIGRVSSGGSLSQQVNLRRLPFVDPGEEIAEFTVTKPNVRVSHGTTVPPKALPNAMVQGQPPAPKQQTLSSLSEYIRSNPRNANPAASRGMLGRLGRAALGAARRHPIGAALAAAGLGSAALYGGYRWLRGRGGSGSEAVAATPPAPALAPEEEVSAPAPAPAPSRADKIRGRLPGGDVVGDGYNLTNPRKYKFRGPAATKDEYRNMMRDAAAASYGKAWSQLTPDEKKTLRDRYYNTQAGAYLDNNNGKNWYVPNFMRDQYGVEEQAMLDDGEVAPFKLKPTDDPYVYPEPEPAPAPQPSGPSQFVQGLRTPEQIRREVQQKSQAGRAAWQEEQAPPPEPEPETPPPPAQNSSRTMTWYNGRPMVNRRNMRRIQSGVAPRVPVFQPFGSQQVEY